MGLDYGVDMHKIGLLAMPKEPIYILLRVTPLTYAIAFLVP